MNKPMNTSYIEPKSDTPEARPIVCPECGEDNDILVGMGDTKNHCVACQYEWFSSKDSDEDVKPVIVDVTVSESVIFKSPEILLTLNQKPTSGFERRLDDAISEALGKHTQENKYCPTCKQTTMHDIGSGRQSFSCQRCHSVKGIDYNKRDHQYPHELRQIDPRHRST